MWNPFKRKPKEPPFNIHHPDLADKVEFAFKCGPTFGKKKYYRFIAAENESNEFDQRTGRYIWMEGFLKQSTRKMDDATITGFLDDLERNLSGEKGNINLVKACQIIITMRAITKMQFEPELVKRLASVVYFDETEDLRTYSREHGERKIRFWEKYDKELSFFLSSPIAELCGVKGLSPEYLLKYTREREQILQDLSFVTPTQSSGNL
jgi:hypothetical protein